MLSVCSINSGLIFIFKLLTASEKYVLKVSTTILSSEIILLLSTRVIFSFDTFLSEKKGFTVFQNFLLSDIRDGLRFP